MSLILNLVRIGEAFQVPLDDFEISMKLALAVGWPEDSLLIEVSPTLEARLLVTLPDGTSKVFSYMDWNVIGPIAVAYNGFPNQYAHKSGHWEAGAVMRGMYGGATEETPQKAIAFAVISAAESLGVFA